MKYLEEGLSVINKLLNSSSASCPVCPVCPETYKYFFFGLLFVVVSFVVFKSISKLQKKLYKKG